MEESKEKPIIITLGKSSLLTVDDIKEYLGNQNLHVETITSPKGFKVVVSSEEFQKLLDRVEDTLKGEKVSFAEDDPSCTVYIKGITKKVDDKDLTAALSDEGKICMTTISKDLQYNPLGTAFVRFNKKEDALRAAEKHSTLTVNEVKLECSKYEPQSKPASTSSTAFANFKNLPSSYDQERVYQLLAEHGQIVDLKYDQENGTGTVSYSNHFGVTKAIQTLNGRKLEDKTFLITDNSEKKKGAATFNNLFVGGIDASVTEEDLKNEFSKYGEIESLLRPTRKITEEGGAVKTIPKNHCFIAFKESKSASDVIKELDGRTLWGKKLAIDYYDPTAKRGPNASVKPEGAAQPQQMMDMMQQMFSMMMTTASTMARGRGGYNSGNQGGYNNRGNNTYNRGRGPRGGQRGGRGTRGSTRGGPPGGQYHVRAGYEQKPMMPGHMGPPLGGMIPPMAPPPSYGGMEHNMVYNPGMHSGQPHGMQPPMQMNKPQQMSEPAPVHNDESGLGYSVQELEDMEKDERDNILGTFLYNKLEPLRGAEEAGKIAGMFLDLPTHEICEIVATDSVFQKYLDEAVDLIATEESTEKQSPLM